MNEYGYENAIPFLFRDLLGDPVIRFATDADSAEHWASDPMLVWTLTFDRQVTPDEWQNVRDAGSLDVFRA